MHRGILKSFFPLIYFASFVIGTKRELQCAHIHEELDLVHVIANGTEDDIHVLWSSHNLPSVIVFRMAHGSKVEIDSKKLASFEDNAVTYDSEPLESIGVTLAQLWTFKDKNDTANMTSSHSVSSLHMQHFHWSDFEPSLSCSKSHASVSVNGSNNETAFSNGGSMDIQFSIAGDQEPSGDFPHLIFTGNSTQIRLVLNNLVTEAYSRFAMLVQVFSSSSDQKWAKHISRSIDDEFSPGVFSSVELASTEAMGNGFVSWRPVAYTGKVPIVANSSDAQMSDYVENPIVSTSSIASIYFGQLPNHSVVAFNMTFGTIGDGFYTKTKYTSWTVMTGTGRAVNREISVTAIIYVSVALGALGLFVLIGGTYALCDRCRKKDDDLLLS